MSPGLLVFDELEKECIDQHQQFLGIDAVYELDDEFFAHDFPSFMRTDVRILTEDGSIFKYEMMSGFRASRNKTNFLVH